MKSSAVLCGAILFFVVQMADARVFELKEQTFSTYLHGTVGTSNVQKYSFAPGLPPSVSFPDGRGVSQQFSGQFGFGYSSSKLITFRLGVEFVGEQGITGLAGVNSNSTALLSLNSELYSVIPQANIEIFIKKSDNWRLYVGGGAGYAVTTLKNSYSVTPAGTSSLGVSDYVEEGTGWGIMGQALSGIEFALFDYVSCSFDLGYRYFVVSNYVSNRTSTTPLGPLTNGSPILNSDGTARRTDLSGPWAGIGLRIYFR